MSTTTEIVYLLSALSFIMALKWMSAVTTARRGVVVGVVGMLLAVAGTMLRPEVDHYRWILIAMGIGAAIGVPMALMPMTAVPQRTALSHAFGALAAALVGAAKFYSSRDGLNSFMLGALMFEVILGCLTFSASLMAFAKLQELLPTRPLLFKGQQIINLGLVLVAIASATLLVSRGGSALFPVMAGAALLFGVLLIIPIGGADMPTVVSLLNSYAGLSAAAMGFVLDNKLLIVAGSLDGASGLILSIIMCKAMNRSFANVLFGGFGQLHATASGEERKPVRSASAEEAASILESATRVMIVPGYGMAVAQAQHKIRELHDALSKRGADIRFAIHPVAGRMPGHMNVLLAEADVPYDKLLELDEANEELPQTDVALIIGANDVTNPAARNDPSSPIYGMPILNVDKARAVMVIKRGMSAGFAGIDNELYAMDHTLMLFGDAKNFTGDIVKSLAA